MRTPRSEAASGSRGSEAGRARLFVALDLPGEFRAALVDWRERALGARDDLRPVAPEALHVTLAFLGARPVEEVEAIGGLVERAVAGLAPVRLAVRDVVPVPARRPRLFAVDLEDVGGRATALQAALSLALAEAGVYRPEARPFWPHITFARVRRGQRPRGLGAPLPAFAPVRAGQVTLYRSRLHPHGARYEAVASVDLASNRR